MFWLLTILAIIGTLYLCDQWERASLRRFAATRDARRAESRAWFETERRCALARRRSLLDPLPWWSMPLLVVFHLLALLMLIDLWGTPRVWMALTQLVWPTSTLLVLWRRRHARATAQAIRSALAVDVAAPPSLTPCVLPR